MVDEILPEAYQRMRTELLRTAGGKSTIDMQKVFLDFTSFVMGHMAYDMDMDSSHPFNKAFDHCSDQIGRRFQNPFYQITEMFDGSGFYDSLLEVKNFGVQIVAQAKQRRGKKAFQSLLTNEAPVFSTLIDGLLESLGDEGLVADSALNFLSAGKDTTAQALTWMLYSVLRHPEMLGPIRQEIDDLFHARETKNGAFKLSVSDLQPINLPIITATFYETLRLYPPIPFEIQQCQQDVDLPDGTFLPRSTVVVWCIWAMNRAKEIHGSDADRFRPSRWLDGDGRFKAKTAFEFPVFNGGPRNCLGKAMSHHMIYFAMINLFQNFSLHEDVDPNTDLIERQSQNSLTLPMADGLPCLVFERC